MKLMLVVVGFWLKPIKVNVFIHRLKPVAIHCINSMCQLIVPFLFCQIIESIDAAI